MIHICDHKLLIFNLLLIMSVVACEMKKILTFTAYEGGRVEIQCPYESGYETYNKYLCRGKCPILNKDIPVESRSAAKDERFSLTDNTVTHIFTVTITDLRTDDQGQYWCAVETGKGKYDDYTEIYLEIKHVSNVSAMTGERLNISCHYESDLNNHVKFICKGSDPSLCETSSIKVSSETNSNGRFSLRDDESAGVFTVTITDLTQEDSGIYWCGAVERGKELKNKWISAIDLFIYDDRHALNQVTSESPKPTTTASDHSSKPATADTASNRPVTSVFPSSSTTSSSALLMLSSSNNAASSKPESGFTMIVMLMVIGILTGFGFSLFMYFRCRQKKEGNQPRDVVQGPTEHLPNGDNEPNREVSDYENISYTLDNPVYSSVLPVFDEHNAAVYALAQLPSSPSDNLTYSSIKFSATPHF
ncbi:CMRF35-like molecule 8 isoform X2 [Ctenopharyngodon idella]|uniref:CMRF35-like molecule 8 isoform X1 n=1 Tax=Ctenopharyngodon idella TaxID=7959 RepID=UPI00222FED12|nr:CMRF35-like molecule 8 isoform X1 [Ctenopharyngodon idella]XP_051742199.1 CMRF35-like molecule 8 isoform X2 [Ctenopharyngodon idella]